MSRGINKVILIGNLGADPEIRYMPSGSAVANVSVATTMSRKNRETGENQDFTEWHRVVLFSRMAEIAGEYLRKGSKVYIEGRLQTRKWQDQNGQDKYSTEIVANDMQMLDSRGGGSGAGSFNQGGSSAGQSQSGGSQQRSSAPAGASTGSSNADDFDDDIPF